MAIVEPPHLLLLPPPPNPPTRLSLSAAYRNPITSVLTKIKTSKPSTLIIALTCPILSQNPNPRLKTVQWQKAQHLLAAVYTLIAHICAQHDINTEMGHYSGSIDTRVLLVDHSHSRVYRPNYDGGFDTNSTTVLDLAAFASKIYPWKTVFHPNGEDGYALLSEFLKFSEGKQVFKQDQLVVVDGGVSLSHDPKVIKREEQEQPEKEIKGYAGVCLGGTFDHIHPGHKLLLHATALLLNIPNEDSGKQSVLIVGISGDELLVKKKFAEQLEDWDTRAHRTLEFLSSILEASTTTSTPVTSAATVGEAEELHAVLRNGTLLVRLSKLHDGFGPTTREEKLDALCVSAETRSGGNAINDKRRESGWEELVTYEVEVLDARDVTEGDDDEKDKEGGFESKISSTAIRQRRAEEAAV